MYPVTTKFRNAFHKPHRRVVKVDVCQFDGTVIQTLAASGFATSSVTDGTVTVDESQQVRRTLSLTIESQGHNIDNLIPRLQSDILNPASMNELRVYRGIDYQDGTPNEYVPLGVFRISKPVITEKTKKSGDVKFEIVITGNDRSSWISRLAWTDPYIIEQGTYLGPAVRGALDNRVGAGKLTYRFAASAESVPINYTVWGMTTSNSNDPWKDITNLITSFGYEMFFDVTGAVVLREIALADTALLPDVACFEEGATCTTTAIVLTLDETSEYNGVICIARGKGIAVAPVRAEVWETAGPTAATGPWGKVPYIFITSAFPIFGQSDAEAQMQAATLATSVLQRLSQQLNEVSISAVPCPFIQEGDIFTVTRSAMGIPTGSQYIASTMVFPLDTTTEMVITNRPKRVQ